tara:strand:- start:162 stop:836 length:675 start_codon:yes stop_codon:yes gene_type:complete
MPTEVRGVVELQKALKKFSPDLAKETRKELALLLAPIVKTARGFIPSEAPLSGWGTTSPNSGWANRGWNTAAAKRGIGYKTTPSKPNKSGFRSLARIVNASAAGAIYETAGRVNPNGREQAPTVTGSNPNPKYAAYFGKKFKNPSKGQGSSFNPGAGNMFIEAMDQYSQIKDASNQTGAGRRTRKMKGRAIFRAWAEDGGKTNAAVIKALQNTSVKFYSALRAK